MKNQLYNLFAACAVLILSLIPNNCFSQENPPEFQLDPQKKSVVIKYDGTEFIGYIISKDAREVLINTDDRGEIYIPMHTIKEIREINPDELYSSGELFASRYFLTTNGLPLKKGERYAMFNWWGPELHTNVADNFSLGVMTTWAAVPLVGSMKISIPATENLNFGIGTLVGTGFWAGLRNVGGLIYGSATFGNYRNNFTVSGGYAGVDINFDGSRESGSAPLASIAFLIQVNQNFSLVGDSFIFLKKDNVGGLFIPGVRYSRANNRAFHFGLAGVVTPDETVPFPIPIIGFFRAF